MAIKLLCFDCRRLRRPRTLSPELKAHSLTPPFEELPRIPNLNLDGAFGHSIFRSKSCRSGRSAHSRSRSRPSTAASKHHQQIETVPEEPVPQIPSQFVNNNNFENRNIVQVVFQEPTAPEVEDHPWNANSPSPPEYLSKEEIAERRRLEHFTTPELDMVSGRTPASAWQMVASKVVAASRAKKGLGREIKVEAFQIEELGGRAGPLVFGPVAMFNGNVTMQVKRPIKDALVSITFQGIVEVDKVLMPFIFITRTLHLGDLQDGFRSFLFGFNFPHVNLPPTSDNPKVAYSFIAKISLDGPPAVSPSDSLANIWRRPGPAEYDSKPLKVHFIPYVDPALEIPLISRKPSMRRRKSKDSRGGLMVKARAKSDVTSAHTLILTDSTVSPKSGSASPGIPKPKLTLTTADIPSSGSGSSTPVIDKPHPSALPSPITRTTHITDDSNETLAKLTVETPNSRLLPGQNIELKVTVQVRDSFQMPKGLGVRVIETRYIAKEVEERLKVEDPEKDETEGPDEDDSSFKMKAIGNEEHRVLTGKKFVIHAESIDPIRKHSVGTGYTVKNQKLDAGLEGGKEVVETVIITLPPFRTFIVDALLPSCALPLGDPKAAAADDASTAAGTTPSSSSPGSSAPTVTLNGSGLKGKSSTQYTLAPGLPNTQELYFKVTHMVQVTIPLQSGGHWYNIGSSPECLEVVVPIILGNKNPNYRSRTPEVRLNAPETASGIGSRLGWGSGSNSGEGSSSGSKRSISRSDSATRSGTGTVIGTASTGWKEGDRFMTLRETAARPGFVLDQD